MSNSDDDGTPRAKRRYDVGYGKPPQHSRFKPGQSGNPRGRPKGVRSFNAQANELLTETIGMKEGDRIKRITMREALLRATIKAALGGDHRARHELFLMIQQSEQEERTRAGNPGLFAELQELDRDILADFQAQLSTKEEDDGN